MADEPFLLVIELTSILFRQKPGKANNSVERCSQFMAHTGQEFALQFGGVLDLPITNLQLSVGGTQALDEFPFFCLSSLPLRDIDCNHSFCRSATEVESVPRDF